MPPEQGRSLLFEVRPRPLAAAIGPRLSVNTGALDMQTEISPPAVSEIRRRRDRRSRPAAIGGRARLSVAAGADLAGFAAGGGVDITARLIGQWLSDRLGQPFVVENRTGAGGNIGTEMVVNAPPMDTRCCLRRNAVNASLYEKLSFNFVRDIRPVAGVIRVPMVVLVYPAVPAQPLPEFISYAKANPGKVNMASAGIGSAPHMAGELFKPMAGVDMVHVPYRGQGPAMTDLLSGQVQVLFAAAPGTADFIKTGKLRALAVTTARACGAAGHSGGGRLRARL